MFVAHAQGTAGAVTACVVNAVAALLWWYVTGELVATLANPHKFWDDKGGVSRRPHVMPHGEWVGEPWLIVS